MPIKTKRWNDPRKKGDGFRLLTCRFRPRALPKENETWDKWYQELGPSKVLHALLYGKAGTPISFEEFTQKYLEEMKKQEYLIKGLAGLVAEGKTITLLCSSACTNSKKCHRTLLKGLIEAQLPVKNDAT